MGYVPPDTSWTAVYHSVRNSIRIFPGSQWSQAEQTHAVKIRKTDFDAAPAKSKMGRMGFSTLP
jgi:hypothetical protein